MLRRKLSGVTRVLSVLAMLAWAQAPAAAAVDESALKICAAAWQAIDPDGDTFADAALAEAGLAAARRCEADGHPLGPVSVANMLGRLGRSDEAAEAVERAMASGRELAAAHQQRCVLEMNKGPAFEAAAMAACNEATRLAPGWYAPYLSRGFMHYRAKRYAEAEREWRAGVDREPRSAPLRQNLGQALYDQQRHAEALEQHLEARRIAPRHSGPVINVGLALEALGRHDEALRVLEDGVRVAPNSGMLLALAQHHQRRGRSAEALAVYDRLLAQDPNNLPALRARGRQAEASKSFASARGYYERALQADPRSVEAAVDVMRVLHLSGASKAELEAADGTALRIANQIGTVEAGKQYRRGVARIARELEDWKSLEQITGRYIGHYPDDVFGYQQRALARRMQENFQGALEDETRVLEFEPGNADSRFWRANAHSALGNLAAAEADYNRLLRDNPKYRWAWHNRAQNRVALGRHGEAYRDFERFLSLHPGIIYMGWDAWAEAGIKSGVPVSQLTDILAARAPRDDVSMMVAAAMLAEQLAD